jgi:hypothetical protein
MEPPAPKIRSKDVIVELARQTSKPLEEVQRVYTRQLAELDEYATVKAFVPVFAKRRTRDILSHY